MGSLISTTSMYLSDNKIQGILSKKLKYPSRLLVSGCSLSIERLKEYLTPSKECDTVLLSKGELEL
jgi:hypothetical protein